jgi:hypothetical protein
MGILYCATPVLSFPLRGKVGMGILYCATPVLSFPLRGKVGMGVVLSKSHLLRTSKSRITTHVCPERRRRESRFTAFNQGNNLRRKQRRLRDTHAERRERILDGG